MTNAAQVQERVNAVAQLLAQGWSSREIVHYAAQQWGVAERQSKTYIQRATALLKADWDRDRQDFLAEMMSCYQVLYRRALEAQQYGAAIGALNAMAKLARVV